MIALATSLLAVMLLTDSDEAPDAKAATAISEDADRVELSTASPKIEAAESADIRSVRCDFDRNNGVILFEEDVVVIYGSDYTMCANQVYAFLTASNELSRIVAVGNVAITNATRAGSCAMATYRRGRHEIEMFGENGGQRAKLIETDGGRSELEGVRIRFWLDSEQVEVDRSTITTKAAGGGRVL